MTWLDVVLATHPGLDPTGRADVASVVHGFVLQPALCAAARPPFRRLPSPLLRRPPITNLLTHHARDVPSTVDPHRPTGRGQ